MDFTFEYNSDFENECDIEEELLSEYSGLSGCKKLIRNIEANDSPLAKEIKHSKIKSDFENKCHEFSFRSNNRNSSCSISNECNSVPNCGNKTRMIKDKYKSVVTTKDQISYMLRLLANRRKSDENTIANANQDDTLFVSMKDVQGKQTQILSLCREL